MNTRNLACFPLKEQVHYSHYNEVKHGSTEKVNSSKR